MDNIEEAIDVVSNVERGGGRDICCIGCVSVFAEMSSDVGITIGTFVCLLNMSELIKIYA